MSAQLPEDHREGKGTLSPRGQDFISTFLFYWPHWSHMATLGCKGGWEIESLFLVALFPN